MRELLPSIAIHMRQLLPSIAMSTAAVFDKALHADCIRLAHYHMLKRIEPIHMLGERGNALPQQHEHLLVAMLSQRHRVHVQ